MSAREVIAEALFKTDRYAGLMKDDWQRAHIYVRGRFLEQADRLMEAGYVILSPDEVRGIRDGALEDAAKVAEDASQKPSDDEQPGDDEWLARTCVNSRGLTISARIRSLKGNRNVE